MTSVIIESREDKLLTQVVENTLKVVKWPVIIFHNDQNEKFVQQEFGDNNMVTLKNIKQKISRVEYSNLLLTEWFWNEIPTEDVLIFQIDTWIYEKSKHKIQEFLDYNLDYIGAPWAHEDDKVGNGGLSLRKKSAMLRVIPHIKGYKHPEDLVCTNKMRKMGGFKIASTEIGKTFSVETIYYKDPFGIHSCWKYISCMDLLKGTPFEDKQKIVNS